MEAVGFMLYLAMYKGAIEPQVPANRAVYMTWGQCTAAKKITNDILRNQDAGVYSVCVPVKFEVAK